MPIQNLISPRCIALMPLTESTPCVAAARRRTRRAVRRGSGRTSAPRCPWCGRPARCCDRGWATRRLRGLPDVAAQQQQVHDLLDRVDGLAMLGDAHRPGDDHALGPDVRIGQLVDLLEREPGREKHLVVVDVGHVLRRTRRSPLQCSARNSWSSTVPGADASASEHALGHGLQQRHVAAQPDLQELVGDVGAATDDAAGGLRVLVAPEPGLGQRVDRHDAWRRSSSRPRAR